MKKSIITVLQFFCLQANEIPIFLSFGRWYYRCAAMIYSRGVTFLNPGICAVYARNSFATNHWVPWESDIDLTVIISAERAENQLRILKKFWRRNFFLTLLFPFIRHIDILTRRQVFSALLAEEPALSFLTGSLKYLYGERLHLPVAVNFGDTASLRVHDWLQILDDFMAGNIKKRFRLRRFGRFFRRFFPLADELAAGKLNRILDSNGGGQRTSALDNRFILSGLHCVSRIVANASSQVSAALPVLSRPERPVVRGHLPLHLLEEARACARRLRGYNDAIAAISVDQGSLVTDKPRLWIVLRRGIEEKRWAETFEMVRVYTGEARKYFSLHIFDAGVLNVFFATQRFWNFEYFHLQSQEIVINGASVIAEIAPPAAGRLRRFAVADRMIKRIALCDTAFTRPPGELRGFTQLVLRLKLFFEENIIATTSAEVAQACRGGALGQDYEVLTKLFAKKRLNRGELFVRLADLLDGMQGCAERYEAVDYAFAAS